MTAEEALETMDERLFYFNDYSKTFSPCIVKISQDLERLEKECQSNSISCDEYLGEIFGDKFDKK